MTSVKTSSSTGFTLMQVPVLQIVDNRVFAAWHIPRIWHAECTFYSVRAQFQNSELT